MNERYLSASIVDFALNSSIKSHGLLPHATLDLMWHVLPKTPCPNWWHSMLSIFYQ